MNYDSTRDGFLKRCTDLVAEQNTSMREICRRAGLSEAVIRNVGKRDEAEPNVRTVRLLAKAFGVAPEWLAFGVGGKAATEETSLPPDTLPIRGVAAGSTLGTALIGDIIDYVERPAGLRHVADAYGLFVVGESMAPRYTPGELVFVHPQRPIARGDNVIVQTRHYDGDKVSVSLKIFETIDDKKLTLRQINPAATSEVARNVVVAVHRVLTTNELFGV